MKKKQTVGKEIREGRKFFSSSKNSNQTDNNTPGDPFEDFFTSYSSNRIETSILNTRQLKRLDLVRWAKEEGLYTFQQALESKSGPVVTLDGKEYKMLSSYDYLGLIGHKGIEKAAIDAVKKFGTSSGGVRLLTGTNQLHRQLEIELAKFKGTEATLSFSSGYHANLAVISALLDPKDLVLVDSKVHQSTIDACKLAGVKYRRFKHNESEELEELLRRNQSKSRVLIISEGMFSMDGDICNLEEIVKLKKKYNVFLMIDEAHSFGVLGDHGKGVDSHYNISPNDIDIFTGSLSKAIPANGGFVAGRMDLIIFLQHGSSPYIFSAAMGPAATASALASLQVLRSEPERIEVLRSNTEFFRNGLNKAGFDTGRSNTPILPVIMGKDQTALNFSRALFDNGILATPVVYPAVPRNQARLRLCITAAQNKQFLEEALDVFIKLKADEL